ncbi:hypothetical protein DW352_25460 [Pseudolabrys taiwanensis]|uniref:Uncharacterized protein n=1 Tax=Pseudolabrys taiwanensis TaxID=331696 RepID=A0A346A331_9HYPH|nr:hypothetical protein [Pseudolabrys taiwanensis]AXK83578.1 hypothetical protein DW352_25460 [Pseudolabrys taiwanensis]
MQASIDYSVKARELFVAAEAQKEPLLRAGFAGMARAYLLLAERANGAPDESDEQAHDETPADA